MRTNPQNTAPIVLHLNRPIQALLNLLIFGYNGANNLVVWGGWISRLVA